MAQDETKTAPPAEWLSVSFRQPEPFNFSNPASWPSRKSRYEDYAAVSGIQRAASNVQCNGVSLELPVNSGEASANGKSTACLAPTENDIAADANLDETLKEEAIEMRWTQAPPAEAPQEDNAATTIDDETEIICSLSSEPKESAVPMGLQDATTQTDEAAQTTASREVQCCPLVTEDAVQTGLVVMSKEEICQLLTPDFFASLKRAELGRILGIVAAVVAQDSQH
ncbi:uncharacterized protein LOC125756261 [Rhipicephalus sanguineus]|uniref:uncharacterized protein LOC125756261 n=1 Tax=Rhipicephalus sanguineus TaxID=34632 RepID=UPI0020C56E32|nr:uncharacterized protein LOC125756261 [Rhipicephalus sanguineus]